LKVATWVNLSQDGAEPGLFQVSINYLSYQITRAHVVLISISL